MPHMIRDRLAPSLLPALALALMLGACSRSAPEPGASSDARPMAPPATQAPQPPSAPPQAPSQAGTPMQAPAASATQSAAAPAAAAYPDFTALVKRQGPAVVNVSTVRTTGAAGRRGAESGGPAAPRGPGAQDDPLQEFFRRFNPHGPGGPGGLRERPPSRAQGVGSGFVISKDGYILTNVHVVDDADSVTVRLADAKRDFPAKVIGIDRRTDVALIKIDAADLPVVTLGHSGQVQVGEWVAAIGSPFGFDNTITAGIVSATERNLPDESFVPFIQTDVAVNPGNSGGPLLNLKGEVIGINSMIYSQTGGYMGVSFAIPIDVAMSVGEQLRTEGKVTRGRIGVQIQPLTQELARSFGLDNPRGVLVTAVESGGPADQARMRPGDVIVRYNDQPIAQVSELPRSVAATRPGTTARVGVLRRGQEETLSVTVAALQAEPVAARAPSPPPEAAQSGDPLGLVVSELAPGERRVLDIGYGLRIESVRGAAAETQIRPGDIVVAVNDTPLKTRDQFRQLIGETAAKGVVALLVRRDDALLYIPVKTG